ncbi:UDP-glycosyltransferase 90A1 [Vitis vinifera]|uniref:UDP-glycosyltransferase 90A1 n=1 Tax=Vitis vinifera TaxID=29760 RepID=A0A438EFQ9_VITVI|nr:UDP-glycosyltransferase 90A1 [Vitis vinifera]
MDGACKEWWYKDKVIGVSKNGYLFIAVTFFTTPANRPFISQYLDGTGASIVDLPFPQQVAGVPAGVESTDKLPCMSLFVPFVKATELLQPHLELRCSTVGVICYERLRHDYVTLLILNRLPLGSESDNEPSTVPQLPWIKLTKNDFEPSFWDANDPLRDFAAETIKSTLQSYGVLVNSFPEVDSLFLDYWNREIGAPKAWCVGPLCLAEPPRVEPKPHEKPTWVRWLDQKLDQGIQVLYVAFGSQADISAEQLQEIATGLEESRANFLWVLRKKRVRHQRRV